MNVAKAEKNKKVVYEEILRTKKGKSATNIWRINNAKKNNKKRISIKDKSTFSR